MASLERVYKRKRPSLLRYMVHRPCVYSGPSRQALALESQSPSLAPILPPVHCLSTFHHCGGRSIFIFPSTSCIHINMVGQYPAFGVVRNTNNERSSAKFKIKYHHEVSIPSTRTQTPMSHAMTPPYPANSLRGNNPSISDILGDGVGGAPANFPDPQLASLISLPPCNGLYPPAPRYPNPGPPLLSNPIATSLSLSN